MCTQVVFNEEAITSRWNSRAGSARWRSTPDQIDRERARGVRQSLLHDGRSGAVRLVETAARFAGGRDRGQTRRQWDQLHGQSERRSPGDLADSVDSSSATYWDLLLLRV